MYYTHCGPEKQHKSIFGNAWVLLIVFIIGAIVAFCVIHYNFYIKIDIGRHVHVHNQAIPSVADSLCSVGGITFIWNSFYPALIKSAF